VTTSRAPNRINFIIPCKIDPLLEPLRVIPCKEEMPLSHARMNPYLVSVPFNARDTEPQLRSRNLETRCNDTN
jgi:hypothetical protein